MDIKAIGQFIKTMRKTKHMTQKELADKVGAHVHAIGYAENNKVGVELAQKIADVLGENVFEVLGKDAFRKIPETEEDKDIIKKTIKE